MTATRDDAMQVFITNQISLEWNNMGTNQTKAVKQIKRLVIFDLDGTLIDSIMDVAICFRQALEALGFQSQDISYVKSAVGGNLEQVITKLLPEDKRSTTNIENVKNSYRKLYLNSEKPNTKPYEGICILLEKLEKQHILIAINTNKAQDLANELVVKIFPATSFVCIVGYDEKYPAKPDPFGVNLILEHCRVSSDDAVYVGDGKSDIETANAANIDMLFVTWGQGTDADKNSLPVSHIVETPDEIHQYVIGTRE